MKLPSLRTLCVSALVLVAGYVIALASEGSSLSQQRHTKNGAAALAPALSKAIGLGVIRGTASQCDSEHAAGRPCITVATERGLLVNQRALSALAAFSEAPCHQARISADLSDYLGCGQAQPSSIVLQVTSLERLTGDEVAAIGPHACTLTFAVVNKVREVRADGDCGTLSAARFQ